MWDLSVDKYDDGTPIVSGSSATISSVEVFNNGSCTPIAPNPQLKLYDQPNFQGNVVYQGGLGFSNAPSANSFSMDMPAGWSAMTWRGDDRTGLSACWSVPVHNFQDFSDWQNKIQSIEVFDHNVCPPPVNPQLKLYDQPNFQGNVVYQGGLGFSNAPSANSFSMDMPAGWSAMTWRGDDRTGLSACWSAPVQNFQDFSDWQNKIQSIEVFDHNMCPPPVNPQLKLYDQPNFQGNVVYQGGLGFSNAPSANSFSMDMPAGWSAMT